MTAMAKETNILSKSYQRSVEQRVEPLSEQDRDRIVARFNALGPAFEKFGVADWRKQAVEQALKEFNV
jgi:hypothetical protein